MKKCIYLGLFLVVFAFIGCRGHLNEGVVLEYGDDCVKILNKNGYITVFEAANVLAYSEEFKKSKEKKIPVHVEIQTEYPIVFFVESREMIKSVEFLK